MEGKTLQRRTARREAFQLGGTVPLLHDASIAVPIEEGSVGGVGPVCGGEEEGGGVRSGQGATRTILLFHIISAWPSKQPLMVRPSSRYMALVLFLFLNN